MKIDPIVNKSHSFDEIFFDLINKSEEVYLATAFVDHINVQKIENTLRKIVPKKRPDIYFITGTFA